MKNKPILIRVSLRKIWKVVKIFMILNWTILVLGINWKIYLCWIMLQEKQRKIRMLEKRKELKLSSCLVLPIKIKISWKALLSRPLIKKNWINLVNPSLLTSLLRNRLQNRLLNRLLNRFQGQNKEEVLQFFIAPFKPKVKRALSYRNIWAMSKDKQK